jgi:hypothetical protein
MRNVALRRAMPRESNKSTSTSDRSAHAVAEMSAIQKAAK